MEFDAEVVVELIVTYGMRVLGAVAILIVGFWAARRIERGVDRALARSGRIDDTLRPFLASLARYAALAFVLIAVLSAFGIETTSLVAVFGAAGLAIGLALQGTLSNLAAGVMLLIFRPFKVGDYVDVGGLAGTVKQLSLFVTELATPDNVQIIVPNGQIWGSAITNFSFHDQRRVDLVLGIDYGASIENARAAVLDEIGKDGRVLGEPEPFVEVGNLGPDSVDLTIRVWCKAADYWPLKFDLTRALKERMDAEGISIPFPQRTVHMVQASG